ncbi:hypothetical protein ACFFK0_21715 [Paenibacillus chartarius]|uniref:Uncharacterized protein n=1 Tax=Paenibacillus chartarius TaxID=747481 RepID=A0ABV6DQT8_9BACL
MNRPPDFTLQLRSGDPQLVQNVVLTGEYGGRTYHESVEINFSGSKYRRDQPMIESFDSSFRYPFPELKSLFERYPQFMRGKREVNSFFEDDGYLAYVSAKSIRDDIQASFRFDVNVWDKKKNQTTSYQVDIPGSEQNHSISVHDVQVIGSELKVLTLNQSRNDAIGFHLYTLSMNDKQTPSDKTLTTVPNGNDDLDTNFQWLPSSKEFGSSPITAIYLVEMKMIQKADGSKQREKSGGRLLVYDIQTGEEIKIRNKEIEDFVKGNGSFFFEVEGTAITILKDAGQTLTAVRYDITAGTTVSRDISIGPADGQIRLKDGHIYKLFPAEMESRMPPKLVVYEAASGSIKYEGSIGVKEPFRDTSDLLSKLAVYNMELR